MGEKREKIVDVLVVGGGPAGIFAAVAASLAGAGVLLLEKNSRLGRKMRLTGGGRCNLTNTAEAGDFINNVPGNGKFLLSALSAFGSNDCVDFFRSIGVNTMVEDRGRVFPRSGRAGDVVEALERQLRERDVRVITGVSVRELILEEGRCTGVKAAGGGVFRSRAVVIAAGGASYPRTGSSGDGYDLARQAGHTIVTPRPGLVPLVSKGNSSVVRLKGLSLRDAVVALLDNTGKRAGYRRGDIIFTHFGVSGPAALGLSREVSRRLADGEQGLTLLVDIFPDTGADELEKRLASLAGERPRKTVAGIAGELLPDRLAQEITGLSSVDGGKKAGEAGRSVWREMAGLIKNFPVKITGTRPLAEAMVTAGGVATREIDPRTMASRLVEGLYFAGEVIDVDGDSGGFNMQIAFSTGRLAGLSAAKCV
ncbi:MAG: NAD(P)/FAD-dependent oxidoreductase [Bacillota bacterium]